MSNEEDIDKLIQKYEEKIRNLELRLESKNNDIQYLKSLVDKLITRPVIIQNIVAPESKVEIDNSNQEQNITADNIIGSVFSIEQISGIVTNTVNQLSSSSEPNKSEIKELLLQLQQAIEAETELSEESKVEALVEVNQLAEIGQNPQDGKMQKLAKRSLRVLKSIANELPTVTTLVEQFNKLLPILAKLFGL